MSNRQIEQKRVKHVISLIKQQLTQFTQTLLQVKHETSLVERNYVQNARINTLEVDDQMETNAEVQQQKQLVAKNLQDQAILQHQIKQLELLKKSPYFGRIDISQANVPETLYIGTSSLMDEQQNFVIYDWRAPICEIYYNGTLGPVTYQTPSGKQQATLLKKRQFTIVDGQIKHMFDTNETIGDEVLQSVLSEQSDEYMKNIVATIQQEQNAIIRDTTSDLLLVQGVAGSGKTSAILQRIAYLLYHDKDSLAADQIILFSPNLLFSHYISEVLPSLGEKNMRQLTLAHFLNRRLEGLQVQNLFDCYELQTSDTTLKFKESKQIMAAVKKYVTELTATQVCFNDLYFEGTILFSKADIAKYYASFPANLTGSARFLATKNYLIKRLNRLIKIQTRCDWVNEQIENLSKQQLHTLLAGKEELTDVNAKQTFLAQHLLKKRYEKIYTAIYNDYFIDTYAQYEHFLNSLNLDKAAKNYADKLELHQIELADCAPLLYLRDLLTGSGQNRHMRHLFIDEMQDYSIALLLYLQHAFPKAKLTLLGDSQQALFHELTTPDKLLSLLQTTLSAKKAKLVKLNKSYRCTYQITNFAKYLIPAGQEIEAFKRNGPLPQLILAPSKQLALKILRSQIQQTTTPIALITKNAKQAKELAIKLRDLDLTLVTSNDQQLPSQRVILPIYLAKGLEFDNVIAFDISAKTYSTEDNGILYTLCSRAMHQLTLIGIEQFPASFQQIPKDHYTFQHILSKKNN